MEKVVSSLESLTWEIWARQDDFWVISFQNVSEYASTFIDRQRGNSLIEEGALAIERADFASLRSIVKELWALVPDSARNNNGKDAVSFESKKADCRLFMIQTLKVGSTLRDTYTVLEKLGEGTFSEVFLVRHRFLGLQAMKVFKSNSHSPTSDQFKEAFILSKLAHPNIVRIFEANKIGVTSGETSYVTMEHAAGGTLHSFLSSRPRLRPDISVRFQKQICAGLSAAHSQEPGNNSPRRETAKHPFDRRRF